MPSEIFQLSADNLMAPLPEDPRLGGPGPFVINLCTSPSPLNVPDRDIPGAGPAHAYPLQRVEDKRVRYRLRLGPFATEDEAIAALAVVRQSFPAALTATADADDLRAIAGISARASARQAAKAPRAETAKPMQRRVEGNQPAAQPAAKQPQPAAKQPYPAATQPHPAAKQPQPAAKQAGPAQARQAQTPTAGTAGAKSAVSGPETGAAPWYVVEFAASDKPFTADALPALDIFSLYRLYSLAGVDKGRTTYVLRLGFFSDEAAAATIAQYLRGHFEAATVKGVTVAERERFAVQQPKASAPAAAAASKPAPR